MFKLYSKETVRYQKLALSFSHVHGKYQIRLNEAYSYSGRGWALFELYGTGNMPFLGFNFVHSITAPEPIYIFLMSKCSS